MSEKIELKKIKLFLKKQGWVLEADSVLPSVVTLIVGKPVKGSWWGHKKGNLIYNTCGLLDDELDVICLKLVNGKRTYVERKYWNLIYNLIDFNRQEIENSLSSDAKKLLLRINKVSLRADKEHPDKKLIIKELEKSLLCHSRSIHTKAGSHTTELVSWNKFFKKKKFEIQKINKEEILDGMSVFSGKYNNLIRFPWN